MEKCCCQTDVEACCACVSMHCDECHKPKQSKFVQGQFCSNCGRPLKGELKPNYVPQSEVDFALQHGYELGKRQVVNDIFTEIITKLCEKIPTKAHIYVIGKPSADEAMDFGRAMALREILAIIGELKKKYEV